MEANDVRRLRIMSLLLAILLGFNLLAFQASAANTNPFNDVKNGDYYYDAVLWAVNHDPQITKGTSATTFSPEKTCTRAETVTFLWRAMGEPAPTRTDNPFMDVKAGQYYYKAVLWANEKGVTNGTSTTTFSPDQTVTRGQVVTFLFRAAKGSSVGSNNPFSDVNTHEYYGSAVLWAVAKGITNGTSNTTFSPNAGCSRGQIVTFLYRYLTSEETSALTPSEILAKDSPAVFLIQTYDKNGNAFLQGCGFFISEDGLAITNDSILFNAYSATALLPNGQKYDITGVLDYSYYVTGQDFAVIKVNGKGFPCIPIADSSTVSNNDKIYSMGIKSGSKIDIDEGNVINRCRTDMVDWIQISQTVDYSNWGGPVVNDKGEAIGVAAKWDQVENFAAPINDVIDRTVPLKSYASYYHPVSLANHADSINVLEQDLAFEELKYFISQNANVDMDDDGINDTYQETITDSTLNVYNIEFLPDLDSIWIYIGVIAPQSDGSRLTFTTDLHLTANGQVYNATSYLLTDGGTTSTIRYVVDAKKWNSNSTISTINNYEGEYPNSSLLELYSMEMRDIVNFANYVLEQRIGGYTMATFGFEQLYDYPMP